MEVVVELNGVRVTTEGIEELDEDGSPLLTVPREEVHNIRVEQGYVAERPLVTLTVGVALSLLAFSLAAAIVYSLLIKDHSLHRKVAYLLAACAATLVLGVWLIGHARRKGVFVAVALRSDRRKLAFRGVPHVDAVNQFTRSLENSPLWSRLVR